MRIRDRMRLVFHAPGGRPGASEPEPAASLPPQEVEFVAYAEDCRLFGHVTLAAGRLTDMLNEADSFELIDVAIEALADGRIVERQSMVVARHELLAVHASGPRGPRERRQRTRPHPITVKSGPYVIRGDLHALPTSDPFVAFRRRPPMVPLTTGAITYMVAGTPVTRSVETLIVNRAAMDWAVPAPSSPMPEVEFPKVPAARGLLVKDFTGEIHGLEHTLGADTADAAVAAAIAGPADSMERARAIGTQGVTAGPGDPADASRAVLAEPTATDPEADDTAAEATAMLRMRARKARRPLRRAV